MPTTSWTYFVGEPCAPSSRTALGDLRVVGGDRAGVAGRAEVLAGVEAGRRRRRPARRRRGRDGVAPCDWAASSTTGTPASRRSSSELARPERPGRRGAPARWPGSAGVIAAATCVGVDQQVLVVDVDEDRHGADPRDRLGRGDERVGRQDHLAAGRDADGPQRELEGVGAVGDADAVRDARRTSAYSARTRRRPGRRRTPWWRRPPRARPAPRRRSRLLGGQVDQRNLHRRPPDRRLMRGTQGRAGTPDPGLAVGQVAQQRRRPCRGWRRAPTAHALADRTRSCRGRRRPDRRTPPPRLTPAQRVAKSSTTSSWVSVTLGITTTCSPMRDVGGQHHARQQRCCPPPTEQPCGTLHRRVHQGGVAVRRRRPAR